MQDYPRFLLEVSRLLRPGGLLLLIEPTLFPCPPPSNNIPNPTSKLQPLNASHSGPAANLSSALRFSAPSSSLSSASPLTYANSRSQAPSTSSTPFANSPQSRLAAAVSPPSTGPHPPTPPNPAHAHQEMPGWAALWRTFRACLTAQRIDVHVPEKLATLLADANGAFENITVHDGTVPVGFWPTGAYQAQYLSLMLWSWKINHQCRPTPSFSRPTPVDGLRTPPAGTTATFPPTWRCTDKCRSSYPGCTARSVPSRIPAIDTDTRRICE